MFADFLAPLFGILDELLRVHEQLSVPASLLLFSILLLSFLFLGSQLLLLEFGLAILEIRLELFATVVRILDQLL